MKFNLFTKKALEKQTKKRAGETKIGERIQLIENLIAEELLNCSAKFVVLGIPEDIGPKANEGNGGANSAWNIFLSKFLNVQENEFILGEDILLLGAFQFPVQANEVSKDLNELRKKVAALDDAVSPIIQLLVASNKIPIVIGGGHNNAYPLLKGSSQALKKSINCLNLDPHADFRGLEGRHSGNGFSYAKQEGFLDRYFVCGLHENYNAQNMLTEMRDKAVGFNFYDGLLRQKHTFVEMIQEGLDFVTKKEFGLELDVDSIQDVPSSAQTPSGISAFEARQYILKASKNSPLYLHLPEAAPSLEKGSEGQVAKLLSYLVTDFIKTRK